MTYEYILGGTSLDLEAQKFADIAGKQEAVEVKARVAEDVTFPVDR